MILDQLEKVNKKVGYYKTILIILIIITVSWIGMGLQSAKNKKFSDKQAQAAAKPISPEFSSETLISLEDKYNPTELELRKITPYTKSSATETRVANVYYQEATESGSLSTQPEATNSSGLLE